MLQIFNIIYFQYEISLESLMPKSSIKLQTLTLGDIPKQKRVPKCTIFPNLIIMILRRNYKKDKGGNIISYEIR